MTCADHDNFNIVNLRSVSNVKLSYISLGYVLMRVGSRSKIHGPTKKCPIK